MSQPEKITAEGSAPQLAKVRLVATDMDGTLTREGLFSASLFEAFSELQAKGIEVMIVTGRSTGWVSGLVHYLPVVGAIAENGGVYIPKATGIPELLPDIPRKSQHRDRLSSVFQRLRHRYPDLQPSVDNAYRTTDWTFDIDGLGADDLDWIQKTCAKLTMGFTYSTVQCHIKLDRQNKAHGLQRVLSTHFPDLSLEQIVTVGDSPNDESLFDQSIFPHSVGVANVTDYLPTLEHHPNYLTDAIEADGFIELAHRLCELKD